MPHVLRFLRGYLRDQGNGIVVSEVALPPPAEGSPATFIRPRGTNPLPAWVLLHGVTVPGRNHPVLTRFANALAYSGAAVIVPEVPAWRDLRLDESAGDAAIRASVAHLRDRSDVTGSISLIGFSFGATQALMSASRDPVREHVRKVVSFGGYSDLGRSLYCMFTGEHEWEGVRYQLDPDPYGRWIVVTNFLDRVPEYAHMEDLRRAAGELAAASGVRGVYAAEPRSDELNRAIRKRLSPEEREVFDLIAPMEGITPPRDAMHQLAERIVTAATTHARGLDPRTDLVNLDQKVVLAHGREDRLIPFTETLRLAAAMPAAVDSSVSITRLFSHSKEADRLRTLAYPREIAKYLTLLRRVLSID